MNERYITKVKNETGSYVTMTFYLKFQIAKYFAGFKYWSTQSIKRFETESEYNKYIKLNNINITKIN